MVHRTQGATKMRFFIVRHRGARNTLCPPPFFLIFPLAAILFSRLLALKIENIGISLSISLPFEKKFGIFSSIGGTTNCGDVDPCNLTQRILFAPISKHVIAAWWWVICAFRISVLPRSMIDVKEIARTFLRFQTG